MVRESRVKENQSRDINNNLITTNHHHSTNNHHRNQTPAMPNLNTAITTSTPHHRQKQTNEKTISAAKQSNRFVTNTPTPQTPNRSTNTTDLSPDPSPFNSHHHLAIQLAPPKRQIRAITPLPPKKT
jgi:hypothetical protein